MPTEKSWKFIVPMTPRTKSGTAGAEQRKVKGNIHWLSAEHAQQAKVRLYDRLFVHAHPDAGGRDYKGFLNPHSKKIITAYVEPSLNQIQPEERFQFERHGYFIADRKDTEPGKPVFNRAVTLRESWGKIYLISGTVRNPLSRGQCKRPFTLWPVSVRHQKPSWARNKRLDR